MNNTHNVTNTRKHFGQALLILELNPAPIDAKIIFEVDNDNQNSGKALSYASTECFSSGRADEEDFDEIEEV